MAVQPDLSVVINTLKFQNVGVRQLVFGHRQGTLILIVITLIPAGVMVGKQLGKKAFDDAYRDARRIMLTGLVGAIGVASLLVLFAGAYTGLYRVDADVQALGKVLLVVFALYAPVKVENMILSGGILRSGGNTRVIMIIDTIGTWGIGIPLCLLAAYGLHWGIVGVYALLTTEEIFRLAVSLVMFKRRSWMISL